MSKRTKTFNCGHEIPENFNPEEMELCGSITDISKIDLQSHEAEVTELYSGIEIYYYYEEKTYQYISNGEPPKARYQHLCLNCLMDTINTREPHYGDGIYFTQHSQLFNNKTHQEVLHSHGIPYRSYKATYVCLDETSFRKIYRSGGVLRSTTHQVESVGGIKMVSLYDNTVFPLCLGW
ncbi:hypothetical protein [Sporosarcina sp. OR05]|uniref:hypothetical protein n=1 Tax=Sporosarcina sp. OR05 TaxID=2969819 RepID=UPI00352B08C8